MTREDLVDAPAERRDVQVALDSHAGGDDVNGITWIELVQEPETLLGKREWQRRVARNVDAFTSIAVTGFGDEASATSLVFARARRNIVAPRPSTAATETNKTMGTMRRGFDSAARDVVGSTVRSPRSSQPISAQSRLR